MSWQRNVFSISLKNSIDNCYLQILQRKWMSENSSTFFMTGTLSSAFSLCGLLIVSVEDCKVFLVRLIEICVNLVVSVVNGLECRVRFKDLSRRDKLFASPISFIRPVPTAIVTAAPTAPIFCGLSTVSTVLPVQSASIWQVTSLRAPPPTNE